MMDFGTSQPSKSTSEGAYLKPEINSDNGTTCNDKTRTPFYTSSPMLPHLQNQEFFNAIESRYNQNGSFAFPLSNNNVLSSPGLSKGTPKQFSFLPQHASKIYQKNDNLKNMAMYSCSEVLPLLHSKKTLLVDVRSFIKYSQCHIKSSINVAIPNTILRRKTFTLEKVGGVIVSEQDRLLWQKAIEDNKSNILFYDEQSEMIKDNDCSAIYYLYLKFDQIGYQGRLGFIQGGMSEFSKIHSDHCSNKNEPTNTQQQRTQSHDSPTVPPTPGISGLPPVVLGSCISSKRSKKRPIEGLHLGGLPTSTVTTSAVQFANHAFNPFFSNIRQNMELCHGSIKERFPVRLPEHVEYDPETGYIKVSSGNNVDDNITMRLNDDACLPIWLKRVVDPDQGPTYTAETYEIIERTEQRRLQHVMSHHSRVCENLTEHPFSIVAGIEKGTLNRYTNVWPFEYTRVKLERGDSNDYINASFIQYIDYDTAKISTPSPSSHDVPKLLSLNEQSKSCLSGRNYRKYISTQGPLPTTFNDFWEVVWEQGSKVIVMLTKEEEMNRVKCHRYWPSMINNPETFGLVQVTLISEEAHFSNSVASKDEAPDLEEGFIVRQFNITCNNETRTLHHFQYKGWQDFGVPSDPLGILQLVSLVNEEQARYESTYDFTGPMIVHCSAGCGRTGAFCAIDTLIFRLKDKAHYTEEERLGELDLLFQTVSKFREQRVSMVQTLRQYVFCYEAILWWMLGL